MKTLLLLVTLLAGVPALAHPGHAAPGVAHDLAHVLWLVEGAAVLAVLLVIALRRDDRRGQ